MFCLEHRTVEKKIAEGKGKFEPGKFPSVSGIDGCNVRAYKISPVGEISGSVIHRNTEFSYEPQYQDIKFEPDNKLLIYLLRGSKEKFGTIEIK